MEKAIIKFGDIEIEKQNFQRHKRPISIKNVDINKMVVSTKVFFGKKGIKYFTDCKDAKIKPLCIFLSKMIAYGRGFNETKHISFLIKMMNYQKNVMKFGRRLKVTLRKNQLINQYTMKNIHKLK